MRLRVCKAEALTPSIRLIRLEAPDGAPLPGFDAGAHLELEFGAGAATVQRKYSLVSPGAERGYYEIAVKRNEYGRGGSVFLHDALAVGDLLEAGAPVSEFRIARDGRRFILIAGGIGITPMLGLAAELEQSGLPYALHYSARSEAEMALRERLPQGGHGVVSLYFTGAAGAARMDVAALLDGCAADKEAHVYVCGPGRLIDAVRIAADERGIREHRIHFESFGPGWEAGDEKVRLTLTESGMELDVEPGTTLLDAMEAAGAWIASECRRGECGACITSYSGGQPIHRDSCLTVQQRASSFCPCVSWAAPGEPLLLNI
ncbi:PDR/VanB family oxidoreductase [Herbaspirillum robiniae]|uniref:PDR/VanB family oxidoreductase n=1 Tax=Herbaspirillum robiniae TaxID=2014887 RepID=UPI003D76E964